MSDFETVAKSEDVSEGQGRPFELGDHRIAIVRHEGQLYAVDDLCPHADASLAFGPIKDGCIICPWHYAAFDLKTGDPCGGPTPRGIRTFEVREIDGEIQVKK